MQQNGSPRSWIGPRSVGPSGTLQVARLSVTREALVWVGYSAEESGRRHSKLPATCGCPLGPGRTSSRSSLSSSSHGTARALAHPFARTAAGGGRERRP
jgi:hypothetical protein